jgi:hypothetical protein
MMLGGGEDQGGRAEIDPSVVDRQIRQAVMMCWLMLPDDKKNIPAVKAVILKIVERVFSDMAEDEQTFGKGWPKAP